MMTDHLPLFSTICSNSLLLLLD